MLSVFASPANGAGISKEEIELITNMKTRNIVRTIFFFATLLLSLAAVASARDDGTC
jgi:hypothetical protein